MIFLYFGIRNVKFYGFLYSMDVDVGDPIVNAKPNDNVVCDIRDIFFDFF